MCVASSPFYTPELQVRHIDPVVLELTELAWRTVVDKEGQRGQAGGAGRAGWRAGWGRVAGSEPFDGRGE
jgi:hypothetical protein